MQQTLARNLWTLQRFGLSPSKLRRRLSNSGAPRVFCVSIPKSGTHLLERALCLHPRLYRSLVPTVFRKDLHRWGGFDGLLDRQKPGHVLMSHLPYEPEYRLGLERRDIPYVFMIRDPRDVVMSHVFNISRTERHRFHEVFRRQPSIEDRIRLIIDGDASIDLPSMDHRLERFSGWLDGATHVVRFEDLVGASGGGATERQLDVLRELYEHVGAPVDEALVRRIGADLFSSASPTFRKGASGEWRRYFDADLEALFAERAGRHLPRYGYAAA